MNRDEVLHAALVQLTHDAVDMALEANPEGFGLDVEWVDADVLSEHLAFLDLDDEEFGAAVAEVGAIARSRLRALEAAGEIAAIAVATAQAPGLNGALRNAGHPLLLLLASTPVAVARPDAVQAALEEASLLEGWNETAPALIRASLD